MSSKQSHQQGNITLVIIGIIVVGIVLLWYFVKQYPQQKAEQETVVTEYSLYQEGPWPTRSLDTDLQDLEQINLDQLNTGLQENATDANAF